MKLNKKDHMALWHYILECGECEEGGRINRDMLYAEMLLNVTNERVNDEIDYDRELAAELAPYVGKRLVITGYTTAYDGFETYEEDINVMEEYRETIVVTRWIHAKGPTLDHERKILGTVPAFMSTTKEAL